MKYHHLAKLALMPGKIRGPAGSCFYKYFHGTCVNYGFSCNFGTCYWSDFFCESVLKVWSTAFEAWSWLFWRFYFIVWWSSWGFGVTPWIFHSQHQKHRYHWSNPPLFSSMYCGVLLLCSSISLSLDHIPWCNDLNLLQGFELCQLCGIFDNSSLTWYRYISSSSPGPCCLDKSLGGMTVEGYCRV